MCFYLSSLSLKINMVYMYFIDTNSSVIVLSIVSTRESKNTCIHSKRSWIFLNAVESDFFFFLKLGKALNYF